MQNTGKSRNTIDKFYTKPDIVDTCLAKWRDIIKPEAKDLIIEPSAGNGAFSNHFINKNNFKSFDIQPQQQDIIQQDFLTLDINQFPQNKIHFIGNPPFGRQSSLAKKFIKHICKSTKSDSISFILPKSFCKESMQHCFPLDFHNIFQYELPDNAFLLNDTSYNVPCVFQIWKKQTNYRFISPIIKPKGFSFVKKNESPDFAIRRVGVYAGSIFNTTSDKSSQSHYFIKLEQNNELDVDMYWSKIDELQTIAKNTVGPKSISKKEIIPRLNLVVSLTS